MKKKLPNFLIIGAAKSGTSSLHHYLNQHPDIFMPSFDKEGMKVKEPRFLIKDLVQNRLHNGVWNWQEYQSLFHEVTNEKAIGESPVLYFYYFKDAIKNIKYRFLENINRQEHDHIIQPIYNILLSLNLCVIIQKIIADIAYPIKYDDDKAPSVVLVILN